jgi:hypothetical protein
MICTGPNNNGALIAIDWLVDIATGDAGSETNVIENMLWSANGVVDQVGSPFVIIPGRDFRSERIAIRSQCNITDATDRVNTFSLIAFRSAGIGKMEVIQSAPRQEAII